MLALTRSVSSTIARCELTHVAREPIDVDRARAQHRDYEEALERLGCTVQRIGGGDDQPDAVFIEDTAVVLPELAILARPGAVSRRGEVDAIADVLTQLTTLVRIESPGTLDGGDVLVVGRTIFAGLSTRTNDAAIAQVRRHAAPFGYRVLTVQTSGCLHLKSAVTMLNQSTILINRQWVPSTFFRDYQAIDVDAREPGAANVVSVGGRVLAAAAYPRTCNRLERSGFDVLRVDVSELARAEGALTCCSILID